MKNYIVKTFFHIKQSLFEVLREFNPLPSFSKQRETKITYNNYYKILLIKTFHNNSCSLNQMEIFSKTKSYINFNQTTFMIKI